MPCILSLFHLASFWSWVTVNKIWPAYWKICQHPSRRPRCEGRCSTGAPWLVDSCVECDSRKWTGNGWGMDGVTQCLCTASIAQVTPCLLHSVHCTGLSAPGLLSPCGRPLERKRGLRNDSEGKAHVCMHVWGGSLDPDTHINVRRLW